MIRARLVHLSATSVWLAAGVCINGAGPFDFVVDTGAAFTLVDAKVAKRLHLPALTQPHTANSFGCRRQESFTKPIALSVDGLPLRPQSLLVGTLANPSLPALAGLLGSDVLSRFAAIRVDYRTATITLARPEAAPLDHDLFAHGQASAVPRSWLRPSWRPVPAEVHVFNEFGVLSAVNPGVHVTAPVTIAGKSLRFIVDTGASRSVIANRVAAGLLPQTGTRSHSYAGLDCPIVNPNYRVRDWSLGNWPLPGQVLFGNDLGFSDDGLLGSGTLEQFEPVIIDYADAVLLLGARRALPTVPTTSATPSG